MKGVEIVAEIQQMLPSFRDEIFYYVDSKLEWFQKMLIDKIFSKDIKNLQTGNSKYSYGLYLRFMMFGSSDSEDFQHSRYVEKMILQFLKKYNDASALTYAKQISYGHPRSGWGSKINDWGSLSALFGLDGMDIEIYVYIKIKGRWYRTTISRSKTDIRHTTMTRGFLNY